MIVDAHCDSLLAAIEKNEGLFDNSIQVGFDKLKKADSRYLQFYAIFLSPSFDSDKAAQYEDKMINLFYKETKEHYVKVVLEKKDLESEGTMALLSYEGLYNDQDIHLLYQKGVRCLSLTWNKDNSFSGGILGKKNSGLTDKGKEAIKVLQEIGILIDVSHISDKGFHDICDISYKPFIASHSNARAVCRHPRNLSNDMIEALSAKGGVMGINLYSEFLSDSKTADINDVLKHIEHICSVAGPDHVGFGSDFDGIPVDKSALNSPSGWCDVINQLYRLNYSEENINKISSLNFIRVLNDVLK